MKYLFYLIGAVLLIGSCKKDEPKKRGFAPFYMETYDIRTPNLTQTDHVLDFTISNGYGVIEHYGDCEYMKDEISKLQGDTAYWVGYAKDISGCTFTPLVLGHNWLVQKQDKQILLKDPETREVEYILTKL